MAGCGKVGTPHFSLYRDIHCFARYQRYCVGAKSREIEGTVNKEFISAINQVCHERQLSKEVVIEAIEAALISAYKRNFGAAQIITAKIDPETGEAQIFVEKEVVPEVIDGKAQIILDEAREYVPEVNIGDVIYIETTPADFGRIAAQTAKQVILQRIREAERDSLYNSYVEREGEIINGTVQSIEPQQVTMSLGKVEAILPRSEQIPTERYSIGQRLRAYVSEVQKTSRGPTIVVSRTHRTMLRRLLELEVPEIFNGTVEIKSIAREAGFRSKVAVAALQEGVDPVGSCVGMRGVRIQSIVNELNGEKIDVVQWSPDVATFIANGLSPAKVLNVILQDANEGKTAVVVVPDKQLSLAIGKEGQNARLAAKLTGWRIDIKSATEAAEEALRKAFEQEPVREATTGSRDILAIAEEILREKEGVALSEGELLALSQAIQIVDQAETALEVKQPAIELEVEAEEAELVGEAGEVLEGAEPDDLLAQAEALLTGKDEAPAELEVEAEAEAEIEVEVEAEAEPVVAEEAETAEAIAAAEATEAAEAIAEEVEAVADAGDEPVEAETTPELELEPAPESEPEAEVPLVWVEEDEEYDDDDDSEEGGRRKGKKKGRRKKRQLVYDEDLGEVVARRRRKPGRERDEWEDFLD
jgi:N utilization substance protein A